MNGSDGYLSIAEEQQAELEVMKELHAFCVKHGLRYILAYGTLLGAIRHKGFIPWDNDMDVIMPREDVEKLVEINKKDPIGKNVRLFHYTTDANYHYPIVRACNTKTIVQPTYLREMIDDMGVWVDIFPMDGYIKSKLIFHVFRNKACIALLKMLPPHWVFRFAHAWSARSRRRHPEPAPFGGRETSLYRFVNEYGRDHDIDLYIFGHWHAPARLPVESGGELIILPAWTQPEDTLVL